MLLSPMGDHEKFRGTHNNLLGVWLLRESSAKLCSFSIRDALWSRSKIAVESRPREERGEELVDQEPKTTIDL